MKPTQVEKVAKEADKIDEEFTDLMVGIACEMFIIREIYRKKKNSLDLAELFTNFMDGDHKLYKSNLKRCLK